MTGNVFRRAIIALLVASMLNPGPLWADARIEFKEPDVITPGEGDPRDASNDGNCFGGGCGSDRDAEAGHAPADRGSGHGDGVNDGRDDGRTYRFDNSGRGGGTSRPQPLPQADRHAVAAVAKEVNEAVVAAVRVATESRERIETVSAYLRWRLSLPKPIEMVPFEELEAGSWEKVGFERGAFPRGLPPNMLLPTSDSQKLNGLQYRLTKLQTKDAAIRARIEDLRDRYNKAKPADERQRTARLEGMEMLVGADDACAGGDKAIANAALAISASLLDVALGFSPLGPAIDAYEAVTGLNYRTGEKLSGEDRAFAVLGMATVGTMSGVTAAMKALRRSKGLSRSLAEAINWLRRLEKDIEVVAIQKGADVNLEAVKMGRVKSYIDDDIVVTGVLKNDKRLWRIWGGKSLRDGRWHIDFDPSGSVKPDFRSLYALSKENSMEYISEKVARKGATVRISRVAPAPEWTAQGGGVQWETLSGTVDEIEEVRKW